MIAVERIIESVIAQREAEAAFDVEILRGAICEDQRGTIEPYHVRHLLEICTGRYHPIREALAALTLLFPRGYVARPRPAGKPRMVKVFVGARIRSPKKTMRFLCQRFRLTGHNSAKRKAWAYFAKLADWSQYPPDERRIFERFALFGEFPQKIGHHLELPANHVRAVLTKHKAAAGIDIDPRGRAQH